MKGIFKRFEPVENVPQEIFEGKEWREEEHRLSHQKQPKMKPTGEQSTTFFLYILEATRALACALIHESWWHVFPSARLGGRGEQPLLQICDTWENRDTQGLGSSAAAITHPAEGLGSKNKASLKTTNQALSLWWPESIMVKIRTFPIWEEDLDFCECFKIWVLITGFRREISQRNNNREQIFRKGRGDTHHQNCILHAGSCS